MTLWEGRLGGTADEVMAFTASLAFDRRLAGDDLDGSRAHVRGLGRAGVLERGGRHPPTALDRVGEELDAGIFSFQPGDEDIHTAVERRVTELAGDVGAKLHTGRSRNDQVATDLRLYTRREMLGVAAAVMELQEVLLRRSVEAAISEAVPVSAGIDGAARPPVDSTKPASRSTRRCFDTVGCGT